MDVLLSVSDLKYSFMKYQYISVPYQPNENYCVDKILWMRNFLSFKKYLCTEEHNNYQFSHDTKLTLLSLKKNWFAFNSALCMTILFKLS